MEEPKQTTPKPARWHPFTWAVIGLAVGTLIVAPLILSRDPQDRLRGGTLFGGVPGAVLGLAYGIGRSHKSGNI